jgi:signal transduction histidine kinase
MTIRGRLLWAFASVAVLLGLPLLYGGLRLRQLGEIAMTLKASHAEGLTAVGGLRAGLVEYDRYSRSYVIAPDPVFRSGMRSALARAGESVARLERVGHHEASAGAHAALDSLARISGILERLVESQETQVATTFLRTTVRPAYDDAAAAVDAIGDAIGLASGAAADSAQRLSADAVRTAGAGGMLALLLAAAVALWATGAIIRPVRRLRVEMASVAAGSFAAPTGLPYRRMDEVGDLCRSFRSMTEQLAHLDHIRGEFLNVITHDLKAPLNIIGGCAELIEEAERTGRRDEAGKLVASIREHVHVLTARVNQLLRVGRLEAEAFQVHPEIVPVGPIFGWGRRAFEPEARRQGIGFSVTIEPSAPAFVLADMESLNHEIIGNLLSNAFKFTPPGGRVALRVWGERTDGKEELHFTVADSGIGIPPDDLPLVFSKYYQVGRGAGAKGGVGLGLAIARRVAEAHGGTIDADSKPGRGAVFHVSLPAPDLRPAGGEDGPAAPPLRVVRAGASGPRKVGRSA